MAYQRHDKDNNPTAAPQPYQRHDENCDVDLDQPAHTEATDVYGNTYRNYNADYVARDVDNNPI